MYRLRHSHPNNRVDNHHSIQCATRRSSLLINPICFQLDSLLRLRRRSQVFYLSGILLNSQLVNLHYSPVLIRLASRRVNQLVLLIVTLLSNHLVNHFAVLLVSHLVNRCENQPANLLGYLPSSLYDYRLLNLRMNRLEFHQINQQFNRC